MLYKDTNRLADELFQTPTAEYRGTPFWAWNTTMTKENVRFMIGVLKDMGMGGGHIHCRTGMANEYLSEEFLDLVKYAHEEFKKRDMLTWLYDEDRWPSGAAGGLVTKNHANRMRFLVFSPEKMECVSNENVSYSSSASAVRSSERKLLARYEVCLKDGYLAHYRRLEEGETITEGETASEVIKEWFAYLEVAGDSPWFNNQAYVNTLDKKAIDCFIEKTHEKYFEALGESFGSDVPAIFTDEPQFSFKQRLGFANEKRAVTIPFSDDFEEDFTKKYGHSLLNSLPELFWELGKDQFSVIRYQYHDFVSERFAEAFADNIGNWCKDHGILLTGHMMEEPTLTSQTAALGEAMRSYRSFGLPGIDMLCDSREYTTAKQAQSASRQFGRPGVMSELYGVTNYTFDFRGHKLQGDWQAALGVTVRVLHLAWTSMAGEAKRDYPASISYQSPWYKEYKQLEDYFARVNTALTRGCAEVKVGVIHPIESFWLYWGNDEQTGDIRRQRDENFTNLVDWLLFGLIDFDFIAESLLLSLETGVTTDSALACGKMKYDVILVPDLVTIRSTTLDLLERFVTAGGKVVFAGKIPSLVDGIASDRPAKLASRSQCVGYTKLDILNAVEPYRNIDIKRASGTRCDNLLYQLRNDKDGKWLFLAPGRKPLTEDIPHGEELTIRIKGLYHPVCYNAMTGVKESIPYRHEEDQTVINTVMFEHDSLLLWLEDTNAGDKVEQANASSYDRIPLVIPEKVSVHTEEPNVLLLDIAESKLDEGEWLAKEEILRIDNHYREQLGYPLRMEAWAQPWVTKEEDAAIIKNNSHTLSLRFSFESKISELPVRLALEHASDCTVNLNGVMADKQILGTYVDMDIDVIALGALKKGTNVIEVTMPYHPAQNVEAMYLLGDFGVDVLGAEAVVKELPANIHFGDISRQGFSFYSGNIDYDMCVDIPFNGKLILSTTYFRCPLIGVTLDGAPMGNIAFSPYKLSLGNVSKGQHTIRLTAYGNRMNTFGTLHLCDEHNAWAGPNAWRSEGSRWSYEYQLQRTGILKKPELFLKRNNECR